MVNKNVYKQTRDYLIIKDFVGRLFFLPKLCSPRLLRVLVYNVSFLSKVFFTGSGARD